MVRQLKSPTKEQHKIEKTSRHLLQLDKLVLKSLEDCDLLYMTIFQYVKGLYVTICSNYIFFIGHSGTDCNMTFKPVDDLYKLSYCLPAQLRGSTEPL